MKKGLLQKTFSVVFLISLALASCAPAGAVGGVVLTNSTSVSTSTPPASPTPNVPVTGSTPTAQSGPAASIPNFDHVVMIMFENQSYSNVIGNPQMPHLNALAQQNVLLSHYYAVAHPSLPNYIALMSGDTQGISSDCNTCFVDQPNLGDEIAASGRTWKAYLEGLPSPCFVGNSGLYVQKHDPLLYFDSIRKNPAICDQSILPLTSLTTDLAANNLPNFSFIMPNLCNSGHNCSPQVADTWLGNMVDTLQSSPSLGNNSLIIILFDEAADSDKSACCNLSSGGGQVAAVLISPTFKQQGFVDPTPYSHYSMLKTILTAWNLPALGKTASSDTPAIEAPWTGVLTTTSPAGQPSSSGDPTNQASCVNSSPSQATYTISICITNPASGSTLTGDTNVTVSTTFTGTPSNLQHMIYYLDGTYLLTDYRSPYLFTLPTSHWADGSHTLSVEATLQDGFTTQQASIPLTFHNGVTSAPVNTTRFQPTTGIPAADGQPITVVAAGDGASGEVNAGLVTNAITALNPNLFLYLGDVYEQGTSTEFYNWYGTSTTFYGQLRAITDPTVGNHEYLTPGASGYFNYWNNIPSYYSFDAGGWHFISLNSNNSFEPTDSKSAQYAWLQKDLAANVGTCTIVYYHHPLYNIGVEKPGTQMTDIWKLLAQSGVTLVLNGHDHDYQRWVPLDGNGNPSPSGVTEFVVGTGGHGLQTITKTDSRVAYYDSTNPTAFGFLVLQLNKNGANFSFQNATGAVLDSGVVPCGSAPADRQAPTAPTGFTVSPNPTIGADLSWTASTDNVGVEGYTIYRNGVAIVSVPSSELNYTDITLAPAGNYVYSVDAYDMAGNHSPKSTPESVNLSSTEGDLSILPEVDTFVSASYPAKNYGRSASLRVKNAPDTHSYIRFTVSGLTGKTVTRALLLLYANTSGRNGITLSAVPSNTWDEMTTVYTNAPALGKVLLNSDPFPSGSWVILDVTPYITGNGTYSFAISTSGPTAISLASRESGASSPKLVLEVK